MQSITEQLRQRFSKAIAEALGPDAAQADPVIRPSQDARFGDYQANCAMALAKQAGVKPRDLAAKIVDALDVAGMCEPPTIAGPGFINLALRPEFLSQSLQSIQTDPRMGVGKVDRPGTVVVDYSGPNVAKLMHVGHLRSTIIGDSIVRLLEFAGQTVVRRNHVGDWGLQMGMVLHATGEMMADFEARHGVGPEADAAVAGELVGQLEAIEDGYKRVTKAIAGDKGVEQSCRDLLAQLQDHDAQPYRRWGWVRQATLQACQAIYDRLGVKLCMDDVQGESAYAEDYEPMTADLVARGLAASDAGALCMFLRDGAGEPLFRSKDGTELPLIVRKRDGTYLYATFDLAALRYRGRVFEPDRIIYTHDARQRIHFEMVFEAARQAGFVGPQVKLDYIPFGTMLGEDRKPFKTRSGGTVRLDGLLDEAVSRARAIVDENSPDLPEDERAQIAARVGIGAVKYNDLSRNIAVDYVFRWDTMLAMDGNTAPYMMYAYARIQSIGRKGGIDYADLDSETRIMLDAPSEAALAKKLLQFGEVFEAASGAGVGGEPAPNVLTSYLFETSQAFSAFYTNCPVLKADSEAVRQSRLRLCEMTARTLGIGLGLLGIETVDRM